jgi:hypothetical protein
LCAEEECVQERDVYRIGCVEERVLVFFGIGICCQNHKEQERYSNNRVYSKCMQNIVFEPE